jgi:hypothetical protein
MYISFFVNQHCQVFLLIFRFFAGNDTLSRVKCVSLKNTQTETFIFQAKNQKDKKKILKDSSALMVFRDKALQCKTWHGQSILP